MATVTVLAAVAQAVMITEVATGSAPKEIQTVAVNPLRIVAMARKQPIVGRVPPPLNPPG